ncbi:MAG TPA: GerMN domain-containing protein [bacterium]|nr:GerMN domain-containing protein [bacterium]
MRKILVIVSLALFFGAVSFLAFYNIANHDESLKDFPRDIIQENKIPGGEPVIEEEPFTVGDETPAEEFVPGNSENLPDSAFENLNIKVTQREIIADENALHVSGEARTFESIVNFKLFDGNGNLLVEDSTLANTHVEGVWGRFSAVINFPAPSTVRGTLQVFQYSAVDLQEIDKIMVPVYFQYNDQMEVKVYFNHNAKAGMPDECSYTQATSRYMTRTTGVARAALTALLQGPTNDEKNNGYFSNIPVGTTLNSIRIENGTAYADFSEELNNTGGSCAVGGIYASINDTLKQFSTVQNVVISVNGRTEDILQP